MRGPLPLVVCLTVSCTTSGGPATSTVGPDAMTCDGQELLKVNCSGCHDGSPEDVGGLDLGARDLVVRLLGKPASGPRCGGQGAVILDRQGDGLLLAKLASPPPCGDRMPQGSYPLSADEIACVVTFVTAGAAGDLPP